MIQIKKGHTFWLPNPINEKDHLHIVCTNPNEKRIVFVVNISHYYNKPCQDHFQDTSCILNIGEHPKIKKPSIVKYDMAKKMNTSRSAVDRLFDPENESMTLQTLNKAATALGKKLRVELV